MRSGCRVEVFGEARGPIRDNIDDAQADAARLKLGRYDQDGRFYLDAGVELKWRPISVRFAA